MILIIVLLMGAVGLGFAAISWRCSSWWIFGLTGGIVLHVGCGPAPAAMLQELQRGYSSNGTDLWTDKNAIVLLGVGTELNWRAEVEPSIFAFSRLARAVALYRQCVSRPQATCTIIVSGGDPQNHGSTEADTYAAELTKLGVNPGDIERESKSQNTWENAKYSSAMVKQSGADHIVLVSSAVHLRRCELYFSHFGVHVFPIAADHLSETPWPLPIAINFMMTDVALHEYAGLARYHIYNVLGWNEPGV
jgi:uncharacterized SAM-binding protein YcdF (DUF218 family)